MKSPSEIAKYLVTKGVIKDEYIQTSGKPTSTLVGYIVDILQDTMNESDNDLEMIAAIRNAKANGVTSEKIYIKDADSFKKYVLVFLPKLKSKNIDWNGWFDSFKETFPKEAYAEKIIDWIESYDDSDDSMFQKTKSNPFMKENNIKESETSLPVIQNLHKAMQIAQAYSKKERCAVHVNELPNGSYKIEDWFDADTTVASYENGNALNENTMKKSKFNKLVDGLIRKALTENVNEEEQAPATEEQLASLEQLQKKLKGFKTLLAKVPDDIKPKVVNKVKQLQKQVDGYVASATPTEPEGKKDNTKKVNEKLGPKKSSIAKKKYTKADYKKAYDFLRKINKQFSELLYQLSINDETDDLELSEACDQISEAGNFDESMSVILDELHSIITDSDN